MSKFKKPKKGSEQYENNRLKFWVTCPLKDCAHKFGVEPRFVMKYLERVAEHFKLEIDEIGELLDATQEKAEGRA